MRDDLQVFERVCHLLWSAGFDISHTRPAGLQIGLRPRGVLVGWRPEEHHDPTPAAAGGIARDPDPDAPARREISRIAVTRALAVILRQADCHVIPLDGDLLVTTTPADPPSPP